MNSTKRRALACTCAAMALGGGAVAAPAVAAIPVRAVTAQARPAAGTGWRIEKEVSARGRSVLLGGIDAVSADDAWVGGVSVPANGTGNDTPLAEHWNGRAWRLITLPAKAARRLGNGFFFGTIGASSARNVWLFSEKGSYLRLNGTRWTFGGLPGYRAGRTFVITIKVFGPDDTWVFGARTLGQEAGLTFTPYAARFDGHTWTPVPVPGRGIMGAVSAPSPDDMWALTGAQAAGAGRKSAATRVLHWNGTAWRIAAQPRLRKDATLSGIAALTPHDVWVGGSHPNRKGGTSELAVRWDGRAWTDASPRSAPTANDYYLAFLTTDGHGGLWALGAELSGPERFWHYSAGSWQPPIRSHWEVLALDGIPRSESVWALAVTADLTAGLILLHGPQPR